MAATLADDGLAQDPSASESVSLEEVVVTSSRIENSLREIGTAMSVVSAQEIELRGYSSMLDILRTQPGIGASNAGGMGKVSAVRVRGEEAYRTLVMVDGVDISDPTGPQVGPSFANLLSTTDIERVEILRGPQGFMYGADAGGVVNIFTRTGAAELSGGLSVEAGSHGTEKLDANLFGGGQRGDFYLSVADLHTDGFNSRVSDTVLMDADGYDNTTMHAKLGWNVADELRLQLVARNIDADSEFDQCGFPTTHDCAEESEQTTMRLSANWAHREATHLVAYAQSEIDRTNIADGFPSFATRGKLSRFEYTGSLRAGSSTRFVYGAELEDEEITPSPGGPLQRDQNALYFEYQGSFSDTWFVTLGARHDSNEDFGEHTSARGAIAHVRTLAGGGQIKYRTSYGTGFRAPSLSEIAYNEGPFAFPPASGVSLKEESSAGYDVGIEYASKGGFAIEATYFDQEIEDEIYFDLSGFSGYLQSIGKSHSSGIELAGRGPIASRWMLLGNLTYNETENTDGTQRIRRPEKIGNVALQFTSADTRVRFVASYRVSRDSVDEIFGIGRVPLDNYDVLDLSVAYALGEKIELFGRIENALDEDYEEVIGYFTGGRMAFAGIRVGF